MSGFQPMGSGGLDTDITTGLPREPKTLEDKRIELEAKEGRILTDALNLSHELPHVAKIMARQLEAKLIQLARKDEFCQSIEAMASEMRAKIEILPKVAAKIRRQMFGPVLNAYVEPEVAPQGIPTEE